MDLVHLHLLLNHIPVAGLALGLLVVGWGFVRKSRDVTTVGLAAFVIAALAAGGTFLTGEPAEDRVGGLAGVSRATIERHEEAAEPALVATIIAGLVAILAVVMPRRQVAVALLAVGAIAFALVARAANLGGHIRHTELAGATAPASTGGENDDDD